MCWHCHLWEKATIFEDNALYSFLFNWNKNDTNFNVSFDMYERCDLFIVNGGISHAWLYHIYIYIDLSANVKYVQKGVLLGGRGGGAGWWGHPTYIDPSLGSIQREYNDLFALPGQLKGAFPWRRQRRAAAAAATYITIYGIIITGLLPNKIKWVATAGVRSSVLGISP